LIIAKPDNGIEIFRRAGEENQPVVFMTDTIYGIGAPLSDRDANYKIFDIKGRERNKPFPVLIGSIEQAEEIAEISDKQRSIMGELWTGPFTLVLNAKPHIDDLYKKNGTIAIRMPDKKWLTDIIKETGPISATSANPSGKEYINDEEEIIRSFGEKVKFFIFENNINSTSSTLIDLTGDKPKILRKGDGRIPDSIKQELL